MGKTKNKLQSVIVSVSTAMVLVIGISLPSKVQAEDNAIIEKSIKSLPVEYVTDVGVMASIVNKKDFNSYFTLYKSSIDYAKDYEITSYQAVRYINEMHNYYLGRDFLYSQADAKELSSMIIKGQLVERYYKGRTNEYKLKFIKSFNKVLEVTYRGGTKYVPGKTPMIDKELSAMNESLIKLGVTTK